MHGKVASRQHRGPELGKIVKMNAFALAPYRLSTYLVTLHREYRYVQDM
jgi:hypothetical protein